MLHVVNVGSVPRALTHDDAVEELHRGDGPTSIIIDVPRMEFNIVNLLLTNSLLQVSISMSLLYPTAVFFNRGSVESNREGATKRHLWPLDAFSELLVCSKCVCV